MWEHEYSENYKFLFGNTRFSLIFNCNSAPVMRVRFEVIWISQPWNLWYNIKRFNLWNSLRCLTSAPGTRNPRDNKNTCCYIITAIYRKCNKSMAKWKTVVTPVLQHWSYHSLPLCHRIFFTSIYHTGVTAVFQNAIKIFYTGMIASSV